MTLRVAAILLLFVTSTSYPQGNDSQRVPRSVYEQWTIAKFVEVGGHAAQTREKAQAQIGKTLSIGAKSFDHDSKFLWFEDSCKNVSYKMQAADSEKGSLGFYGLEQEDSGQFLVVSCSNRDLYFLELAKNEELAVYYDGWFFFLRKSTGAA
jgi:hypothetical protein